MALVKGAYEIGKNEGTDSTGEPDTFVLTPVFRNIIEELIKVTDRLVFLSTYNCAIKGLMAINPICDWPRLKRLWS